MPDPIIGQIPAESLLSETAATVNTPAPVQVLETTPSTDKLSFEEFNTAQPLGIKPKLTEDGKLVKEPSPKVKVPSTEAVEYTNETLKEKPIEEGEETKEDDVKEVEEASEDNGEAEQSTETEGEEGEVKDKEEEKLHGNTKRDYSGFTNEEIKLLKRLDNSRFQTISTNWKALKSAANKSVELAKELVSAKQLLKDSGIPETWHEHPEAYQLSTQYNNIATQYAQQDALENHQAHSKASLINKYFSGQLLLLHV